MTTLCICGHTKDQHRNKDQDKNGACDYHGHTCLCTGYTAQAEGTHLLRPEHVGLAGMREFYAKTNTYATSTNGDTALIRSHIAYHSGIATAERATIKPSRGHSYRINGDHIVKITDHYDHRNGVTGWI
jgi:hypothetical protein